MGGYRYLVLVGGLAGALIALAGVLLSAARLETVERDLPVVEDRIVITTGERPSARPRGPGHVREALRLAAGRPEKLVAHLTAIREGLTRARAGEVEALRGVQRAHAQALELVFPEDWPLLEKELGRTDAPDGYRSLLVVLAGASRAEGALPLLRDEYALRRLKAIDALQRHGGATALGVIIGLYDAAADAAERAALLRATRSFPGEHVAAFLRRLLAEEEDPEALLAAVTECRFHGGSGEAMAEMLESFARSPRSSMHVDVLPRALNSLAALPSGTARLLELATDQGLDELRRARAAEALSWSTDPALVPVVLATLVSQPANPEPRVRFLQRSVSAADLAGVDEVMGSCDPALRALLTEATAHLR